VDDGSQGAKIVKLPSSEEVRSTMELARSASESGDFERAEALLHTLPVRSVDGVEAVNLRVDALLRLGRDEDATEVLGLACAHVESTPLRLQYAKLLLHANRWTEALACYRAAFEQDESPTTMVGIGRALLAGDQEDAAIDAFSHAFELDHRQTEALTARGGIYMAQACFVAALADYATCCTLEPERAQHWVNRGNAWYELGEFDFATRDYEMALSLDARLAEVSLNLGCIALDEDEIEHAIRHFNRAIEIDDQMARAFLNRGLAYFYREVDPKAQRDFERAIRLDPTDADAYFALARLHARQSRYRESTERLDQALTRCPDYVDELLSDDLFDELRKLRKVKQLITRAEERLT